MMTRMFAWGAAMLAPVAAVAAGQKDSLGARDVSAASGAAMYRAYCASCHGVDGRGNGPAAPALKIPPPDLTTLAKRHGGKFPQLMVFQSIEGEAATTAHGSRDMPVWGTVFRGLGGSDEARVKLRVRNLTRHIESLQQ